MKRPRDPNGAIEPQELPLMERIFCGVIVVILVLGAVWVSTHLR